MYITKINLSGELLDSYEKVTDWLNDRTWKPFYAKGAEVPAMPEIIQASLQKRMFCTPQNDRRFFSGLCWPVAVGQSQSRQQQSAVSTTTCRWHSSRPSGKMEHLVGRQRYFDTNGGLLRRENWHQVRCTGYWLSLSTQC